MDLKGAGKWGIAGVVGLAGTAGALGAFFFNSKSGEKHRRAVTKQTKAVAQRERAHIMAIVAKRAPREEIASSALKQTVRDALDAAGGQDIEVNVRGGVVRLRGDVSDMAEIRTYGRVVAAIEGVKEVDNVLRYSS